MPTTTRVETRQGTNLMQHPLWLPNTIEVSRSKAAEGRQGNFFQQEATPSVPCRAEMPVAPAQQCRVRGNAA
eukprot:8018172-Lingulodinium_polyedra.AAC.1